MTLPKAVRSSLIGLPVLSLLLVILLGSLQVAVSLLLSSILCTLGIAVVFWWFVAWAIGKLMVAIYQAVTQRWGGGDRASANSISSTITINDLTPQQQAVISYVQTVLISADLMSAEGDRAPRSQAITVEQINAALKRAGWSLEEIQAAYDWINQQAQSSDPLD